MRLILTAVPGCGKTTIINELKKLADAKVVNFGDMMFEEAKKRGAKNRDETRKLSAEENKEMQMEVAKRIAKMGDVVIDSHCTIKTNEGYIPGFPEDVLKVLKPDMFVLVEKSPEEIAARRAGDKVRATRDLETEEEIIEHQEINRAEAESYKKFGCDVKVINLNYPEKKQFDHAKDAAKQIAEMLEE